MASKITVAISDDQEADALYLNVDLNIQFQDMLEGNAARANERRLSELRQKASVLPQPVIKTILDEATAAVDDAIAGR